jgi:hypothetical protein
MSGVLVSKERKRGLAADPDAMMVAPFGMATRLMAVMAAIVAMVVPTIVAVVVPVVAAVIALVVATIIILCGGGGAEAERRDRDAGGNQMRDLHR